MAIRFRKEGVLDTIQDLGRLGFRRQGVNPNGAMDAAAVRVLNTLLGNDENEAIVEMHFPAGEIEFEAESAFCIAGADFDARLDGERISPWGTHNAKNGSVLRFAGKLDGERVYLGVAGGFRIQPWLGSLSTNLIAQAGGFDGRRLLTGDRIELKNPALAKLSSVAVIAGPSVRSNRSSPSAIRITPGPEFELLTAISVQTLLGSTFEISTQSNRMGFRMSAAELSLIDDTELVSSAVEFGTMQLLPSGQLVILMADHQTTGGYPRIGNVIKRDLPKLAQTNIGASVTFELVTISEPESLDFEFERSLKFLRAGCDLGTANRR